MTIIINQELRIKKNKTNKSVSAFNFMNFQLYRLPSGFTLFEIILVVAMIAIIASLAPPVFMRFQKKIGFDSTVSTYVSSLYRAQNLSEAVKNDSSWGVKITSNDVTIFKGSSFDTRDQTFDDVSNLFSYLEITGSTEFVFKKMYGTPILFGTTTISNQFGDIKNISVNSTGLISFEK